MNSVCARAHPPRTPRECVNAPRGRGSYAAHTHRQNGHHDELHGYTRDVWKRHGSLRETDVF
jgi:hypothetical protein